MRGGGISPHHLFSRSPGRALDLSRAGRGGSSRSAGASVQRQSRNRGRSGDARPPLRHLARSAQEAILPVRPGRRRSRPYRGFVRHHVGQNRRARDLCRAWPRGARALRDGCAQALDGLGRTGLRARIRSRRFQHCRGLRFQYGRDGEQGPQRLQRQICPRVARDRDRRRLRQHRRRDRARIFSQLDRRTASPAATGSSFASKRA